MQPVFGVQFAGALVCAPPHPRPLPWDYLLAGNLSVKRRGGIIGEGGKKSLSRNPFSHVYVYNLLNEATVLPRRNKKCVGLQTTHPGSVF